MDFRQLTDDQVKEYLISHVSEFGEEYHLSSSSFEGQSIAIERWEHGFAVILEPHTQNVQLWWLYVDADHRGRKLGRRYLRDVLAKYGQEWRMCLVCDVKLRAFYSSFGFRVTEKDGRKRLMQMKEG